MRRNTVTDENVSRLAFDSFGEANPPTADDFLVRRLRLTHLENDSVRPRPAAVDSGITPRYAQATSEKTGTGKNLPPRNFARAQ